MARTHIQNVWAAVARFLELLLKYLANEDTYEKISRHWLVPSMEKRLSSAYSKLDELLEVHNDYPMTTNSHYINFHKHQNIKDAEEESDALLRIENTKDISTVLSKIDMVTAEEAFDKMNAFYDVRRRVFRC